MQKDPSQDHSRIDQTTQSVQTGKDTEHETRALSDAEAFEIVKAARKILINNEARRHARKDTPTSEATIRDYAKKCRQIENEIQKITHDCPSPLREAMASHARSKQSFQALKSALRWQGHAQLQSLLRAQDSLQRTGQRGAQWHYLVAQLSTIMHRLQSVDALDRAECLRWLHKPAKRPKSKRRLLPRLDEDWRKRFLAINGESPTYRHAGVLLAHCGLRPAELERGVRIRFTPRGVRVLIAGAKVRETAGQPWRTFLLNPSQLPSWFVDELRQGRRMVVRAEPDPLRSHLYKISQTVLNPKNKRRDQDLILSAYLFRHAFVTDLREHGWESEQIAACMGESAAATVSYYGTRRHSGSRAVKPPVAIVVGSVRTPRAVRPLDDDGLKAQLTRQRKRPTLLPRR